MLDDGLTGVSEVYRYAKAQRDEYQAREAVFRAAAQDVIDLLREMNVDDSRIDALKSAVRVLSENRD